MFLSYHILAQESYMFVLIWQLPGKFCVDGMKGIHKMTGTGFRTEEFVVDGDRLIAKLKELLHEGTIRRITIKNEDGNVLIDFPLTIGVVGVLLAPQLAAVGAIAALVTRCTLVVEKDSPAAE
jgi:hypothetical protein